MPLPWLGQLLVGLFLNIVSYLLAPKPKQEQPPSTEDLQEPTAEAGRPMVVVMGSMRLKGANLIGAWDKQSVHRKAKAGKK